MQREAGGKSLGVFVLLLALFLSSCASRRNVGVSASQASSFPEIVHLAVPFYENTSDQCGPATLAGLLGYWGKPADLADLKSEIYVPGLGGSLPMDLRPALEKRGMTAVVASANFDVIKEELRQSRPVIAYMNFGTKRRPIGHFLIVVGYDENRRGLYVHSGSAKDKFSSYRRFDRGWKDTDRWLLIAKPDDGAALSISPTSWTGAVIEPVMSADDHLRLGVLYEGQNLPHLAELQYRRALAKNARFDPALIAIGNLAFHAGDYRQAAKHYRRVLKIQPDHGAANNNLAMVLLATGGNLKRAETLATRALSTDVRSYAEDTLLQIRSLKSGPDVKKTTFSVEGF
jgi:tetratricopeptide (TPR) repeat protein